MSLGVIAFKMEHSILPTVITASELLGVRGKEQLVGGRGVSCFECGGGGIREGGVSGGLCCVYLRSFI